jgi:uncharacterized protein YukE
MGHANRLQRILADWSGQTDDVSDYWRDAVADRFLNHDVAEITSVVEHLVSQIQQVSEELDKIDRVIKDSERS